MSSTVILVVTPLLVILNCTPATATLSLAVAVTDTVVPDITDELVGEVRETVGTVESAPPPGGGVSVPSSIAPISYVPLRVLPKKSEKTGTLVPVLMA